MTNNDNIWSDEQRAEQRWLNYIVDTLEEEGVSTKDMSDDEVENAYFSLFVN